MNYSSSLIKPKSLLILFASFSFWWLRSQHELYQSFLLIPCREYLCSLYLCNSNLACGLALILNLTYRFPRASWAQIFSIHFEGRVHLETIAQPVLFFWLVNKMAPSSVVGRKMHGLFAVKIVKWLKQISYSGSRLRTADCWTLSGNTTYVKMSLAIVKFVLVVNKVGNVIMIIFLKVKAVWVKIFRSYVVWWSFFILLLLKKNASGFCRFLPEHIFRPSGLPAWRRLLIPLLHAEKGRLRNLVANRVPASRWQGILFLINCEIISG